MVIPCRGRWIEAALGAALALWAGTGACDRSCLHHKLIEDFFTDKNVSPPASLEQAISEL